MKPSDIDWDAELADTSNNDPFRGEAEGARPLAPPTVYATASGKALQSILTQGLDLADAAMAAGHWGELWARDASLACVPHACREVNQHAALRHLPPPPTNPRPPSPTFDRCCAHGPRRLCAHGQRSATHIPCLPCCGSGSVRHDRERSHAGSRRGGGCLPEPPCFLCGSSPGGPHRRPQLPRGGCHAHEGRAGAPRVRICKCLGRSGGRPSCRGLGEDAGCRRSSQGPAFCRSSACAVRLLYKWADSRVYRHPGVMESWLSMTCCRLHPGLGVRAQTQSVHFGTEQVIRGKKVSLLGEYSNQLSYEVGHWG